MADIIPQIQDGLDRLCEFVKERHQIYMRRFVEKQPPPWTGDTILQTYKFCNVYRELDRVTIWIREHIREPFADHPALWFMLAIARQINWPETLEELIKDKKGAWPTTNDWWDYHRAARIMLDRKARGETVYTGAYMLTCQPASLVRDGEKAWFTTEIALKSVWADRLCVEPRLHTTLQEAFKSLLPHHGWGDFLTAQVIADLKHTRYLKDAPDWWDWAVLGPGSRRGLNRVLGREPVDKTFRTEESLNWLREVRAYLDGMSGLPPLCLQDTQNVLCEFSKYEKARLGLGRPRSKFRPINKSNGVLL